MGSEARPNEPVAMPPLVTKHFGKEIFTKTQQYDDLAASVTVPRSPITPRHITKVIHTQFGAANDVIAVLQTEKQSDGAGRIHGFLDVLTPEGKKIPALEPMRVELSYTRPTPEEEEVIEEHRKTLIWGVHDMLWGQLPKPAGSSLRDFDTGAAAYGPDPFDDGPGVKRTLSYSAVAAAASRAAIPDAYLQLYKRLADWLEGFKPSDVRVIRSLPVLNENGKVLVGHVCTAQQMFLHEAQVDIFDVFLHQILELWLPLYHKARPEPSGRTLIHLTVPVEDTPVSSPSSSSEGATPPLSPEPSFLPPPPPITTAPHPLPAKKHIRALRIELHPDEESTEVVTVGVDALIRGAARPRAEATAPPPEDVAALRRLGDPQARGMMSFLVLRNFVLQGVEFTPSPGMRILTPASHRESLDNRGFIAFEPHPDDIALFAGAFVCEAKGVVPIHMISCMPDPAGITDQYLADLLALTTFAIDNPNVSSRLVHAKLIGRSVFGDRGEASDAAAKLRGLFTPREQLALANRFKMNFPALDMGEVDRIRSLFTPTEWRRHKRSLRVYEGYLGFQYMGQETDETDYTNMVWDLPLVKGAFSPNGTLLSYWSKYQAPTDKDAAKLRQTLRSLNHMGTVILPAPHHRHPQHRQLTRVALPLIQEELPHARIMLYEDLTGFTHLRANMLNCIEGGTGMWMAKVWEAYGSQEARNPYRAMWYNHVRRAALREADVIEDQVREEKWQHLAERFVVGTLRKFAS